MKQMKHKERSQIKFRMMKVGIWVFTKSVRLVTLLLAVCILTYILMEYAPVDPIQAYIGADLMRVGPEQREAIATYWGLDQPPLQRFLHWGRAVLQGDFGRSMIYRESVLEVIGERFRYSLSLMLTAWLLSGLLGFSIGVLAAMHKDRRLDRWIRWFCYTLASTPTFWFGLLLLIIFAVWLRWLPIGLGVPAGIAASEVTFGDRVLHMLLPAMTLSVIGMAGVALHTRQKLVDVLDSDYVRFARARGERGWRLVKRHGLRSIALPAISLQFTSFGELFGGAVLAEQVFSYPGLGQATVEAGLRGDVPLLMGIVLFSTIFVFTGNVLADLITQWMDPRIREGERR